VAVLLPGPGAYVIVLSNRFSTLSAKQVTGSIGLLWEEDPAAARGPDSTRAASDSTGR
jgi:hypothetical protein